MDEERANRGVLAPALPGLLLLVLQHPPLLLIGGFELLIKLRLQLHRHRAVDAQASISPPSCDAITMVVLRDVAAADESRFAVDDEQLDRPDLMLVAIRANQGEFFKDLGESQLRLFREKFASLLPIHHMVNHK